MWSLLISDSHDVGTMVSEIATVNGSSLAIGTNNSNLHSISRAHLPDCLESLSSTGLSNHGSLCIEAKSFGSEHK